MIGLKRRLTYDELLDKLDVDPIKKYPDRRATQIENSNYMSQLASGFQEVLEQHDRVMKEKTKALLLQDYAQSHHISHKELKSMSGGNTSEGLDSMKSAVNFIDSGDESAKSAVSNTRSTYKFLANARAQHIELQQGIMEQQREIIEGEKGRQHEAALSVAEDLVRRQYNMQRQYEDQLALRDYDMMQQEQRQLQNLQNTRQQASALLAGIYGQGVHRMIGGPISGSSSSSSAALPPMRLAIQDVSAPLIAEKYKIHSDSEEEEVMVAPGKLQPREEDVKHLYQPRPNRATKDTLTTSTGLNEKIYRKGYDNWMNESRDVLLKQLRFRPDITKGIKQKEVNSYNKDKLVSMIVLYDNNKS